MDDPITGRSATGALHFRAHLPSPSIFSTGLLAAVVMQLAGCAKVNLYNFGALKEFRRQRDVIRIYVNVIWQLSTSYGSDTTAVTKAWPLYRLKS